MKILLIHNQYIFKGGEDSVFEAEHTLLKEYGHDVQLLVFDNKNIVSVKDKIFAGIMTFFNIQSAQMLKQKILEFQPDIIHVHNFFPIASPSIFFTAHKANIPIIMTLHNYRLICPNALLYRNNAVCELCIHKPFALDGVVHGCYRDSRLQTFLLAVTTWFHAFSRTWQHKITRYTALTYFEKRKFLDASLSLKEQQITIKPNFVQDHGYDLKKEDYFLYVGRLSVEKGIETILNTFKNSNIPLYLLGTGPLEEKVKESMNTHPNIVWLGFQHKEDVIKKLRGAKALIFSSACYETFGMSIIEAFSTGTPVICSDHGAPAELVDHMKTGFHFQSGSSMDLAQKVEWINTHPELHYQLCVNARQEYETKYTSEKNYQMLMKIYEEAIHAKTKNS